MKQNLLTSHTKHLVPSAYQKVKYTKTNMQLSAAGLFKYTWPLCEHEALNGLNANMSREKTVVNPDW